MNRGYYLASRGAGPRLQAVWRGESQPKLIKCLLIISFCLLGAGRACSEDLVDRPSLSSSQ